METARGSQRASDPLPGRGDSRLRRLAWGFAPVLTFVVLIALWGALVAIFRVPDYLVPAPQAVIPKLSRPGRRCGRTP